MIWPDSYGARWIVVGYEDEGYVVHARRAGSEDREVQKEYERIPMFLNRWKSGWSSREKVVAYPKFVIGEKTRITSPREVLLRSLRRIVALVQEADIVEGGGTIYCGFRAYEAWIGDMRKISYERLDDEAKGNVISFNGFLLPSLISDREAAAYYLKEIAAKFEGTERDALSEASKQYEKLASMLKEIESLAPQGDWRTASFEEEEQKKFANYPRVSQMASEAYALEREAISVLEEVIAGP